MDALASLEPQPQVGAPPAAAAPSSSKWSLRSAKYSAHPALWRKTSRRLRSTSRSSWMDSRMMQFLVTRAGLERSSASAAMSSHSANSCASAGRCSVCYCVTTSSHEMRGIPSPPSASPAPMASPPPPPLPSTARDPLLRVQVLTGGCGGRARRVVHVLLGVELGAPLRRELRVPHDSAAWHGGGRG